MPEATAPGRPGGASGGAAAPTGLVVVSHSRRLAEGVVELAQQMAPDVVIVPAGGMADGGLGTSFDVVAEALAGVLGRAESAVILADLGSAVLTVESVLEFDDDARARARLADAPLVEGAVAAAVTANGGAGPAEVQRSAEGAAGLVKAPGAAGAVGAVEPGAAAGGEPAGGALRAVVTLRNKLGLHARPAALVARMIAGFDAEVTINGVDGASVLALMTLGATGGQELTVEARGNAARAALAAVVEAVEGGFDEE